MACRVQKRISSARRKLHLLKVLNKFKSVKRDPIPFSAALHQMNKLSRLIESVRREYADLITARREYLSILKVVKNVKVEKVGSGFAVRVTCEKEEDSLVTILEAFDKMGLNVVQANVSCNDVLSLEAIVDAENKTIDVEEITQGIIDAIN